MWVSHLVYVGHEFITRFEKTKAKQLCLLVVSAKMALSTLGGKDVESLALFLSQKGFQNEIIICLDGMVVAFLIFLYFFGEFRPD